MSLMVQLARVFAALDLLPIYDIRPYFLSPSYVGLCDSNPGSHRNLSSPLGSPLRFVLCIISREDSSPSVVDSRL